MHTHTRHFFEFGDFRLDIEDRLLRKSDVVVPLTPKSTDLLFILVENSAHVLEKNRIMDEVWPGTYVEEGCLSQNISHLRKILGNHVHPHRYIETIPRRGYCFVAAVREIKQDDEGNVTVLDFANGLTGEVSAAQGFGDRTAPLRGASHFVAFWSRYWKSDGKTVVFVWLAVAIVVVLAFFRYCGEGW